MAERRSYLLRIDPATLEALRRWAADDLRSLNGQIEFLLHRCLRESGRLRREPPPDPARGPETPPVGHADERD